jgi:hypothetical protein
VSIPEFPDFHVALLRNHQLVTTVTDQSPAQRVVVTAGLSATGLPNVETSEISDAKGGAPYEKDVAIAMAKVRPGGAPPWSGTPSFVGTPPTNSTCIDNYAQPSKGTTEPGTPYTHCYLWLDTKP